MHPFLSSNTVVLKQTMNLFVHQQHLINCIACNLMGMQKDLIYCNCIKLNLRIKHFSIVPTSYLHNEYNVENNNRIKKSSGNSLSNITELELLYMSKVVNGKFGRSRYLM